MSDAYERTRREQNADLVLRERFRRIKQGWGDSVIAFSLIYMFFFGVLLVADPFFHAIPQSVGWGLWGQASLVFFGILFMLLALYGELYPERGAGAVATIVLSGLGLVTSTVVQLNPIGILFWGLVAAAALWETVRRVQKSGRR